MARMHPLLVLMGFIIPLAACIVGCFNSPVAYASLAESMSVRETTLMAQRSLTESTGFWLPCFKFSGMALILGRIAMTVWVMARTLGVALDRYGGDAWQRQ